MTTSNEVLSARDLKSWDVLWASALGAGFLRPAPGTWGSAVALLVWWFGLSALPIWQQAIITLIYALSGWWVSERICQRFGVKDASEIVADEVAGMWLALMCLPAIWWLALLGFVLFRLLDIAKPGPIGWLDQRVDGGLGVMADDLLAGVVTGVVLWITYFLIV